MEEKILNIYGSEEKLRDVAEKAEKNLKTYEIEKNGTIQGEVKALDEKEARIMVSERYGEDNFRLIEREPKMENEEEADKDKMKGDKVVNALDDEKKETLVEEVEEHQTSYKELAGKLLQDKYFEYLLNEKQNNAVADYLINNPNTEPIKLTPQDNLAMAERWQQEINNPTEMSKGMTINQIAEKEANYHSLYNHGMKQEQTYNNLFLGKERIDYGGIYENDKVVLQENGEIRKYEHGEYGVYFDEDLAKEDLKAGDKIINITELPIDKIREIKENIEHFDLIRHQNKLLTEDDLVKRQEKEMYQILMKEEIEPVDKQEIVSNLTFNMEAITPQEKVNEIFNEIQEKFNPKEKAFLELKMIEFIGSKHNLGMAEVGNHLTSEEIQNVNQYLSKLEEKYFNPIEDEDFGLVDENYNKLLSKVVYEMETNNAFMNDVNPIFLEVAQNIQKRKEQFNIIEHLNNQMKYLGFGDNHKEEIRKGIDSNDKSFQIKTTSDRVMESNQVDFAVNFNKSEKGGVFLNSFDARLITQEGEERSHNFKLNFTAKEAINLLEGRAVKTEFNNSKTNEPFESFVSESRPDRKNFSKILRSFFIFIF